MNIILQIIYCWLCNIPVLSMLRILCILLYVLILPLQTVSMILLWLYILNYNCLLRKLRYEAIKITAIKIYQPNIFMTPSKTLLFSKIFWYILIHSCQSLSSLTLLTGSVISGKYISTVKCIYLSVTWFTSCKYFLKFILHCINAYKVRCSIIYGGM